MELFDFLTANYDVRKRPSSQESPLEIVNSIFVYFIGNFKAQNLEFETHLLFRHKWKVGHRTYRHQTHINQTIRHTYTRHTDTQTHTDFRANVTGSETELCQLHRRHHGDQRPGLDHWGHLDPQHLHREREGELPAPEHQRLLLCPDNTVRRSRLPLQSQNFADV